MIFDPEGIISTADNATNGDKKIAAATNNIFGMLKKGIQHFFHGRCTCILITYNRIKRRKEGKIVITSPIVSTSFNVDKCEGGTSTV